MGAIGVVLVDLGRELFCGLGVPIDLYEGAEGSVFKDIAKDGTVSWRVRVDMVDPVTGKRCQP